MTVNRAAAVGHLLDVRAVALDGALEAVALGGAGDIHMVARSEGVGLDLGADFQRSSVIQLEFLEVLLCGQTRLLEMAQLRLGQLLLGDIAVSQLHGNIAIVFEGLLLSDDARACLNDSDRNDVAELIEDLGHAHFLADDCFLHGFYSFCLGYWLANLTIGQPLVYQHDPGPSRQTVGVRRIPIINR